MKLSDFPRMVSSALYLSRIDKLYARCLPDISVKTMHLYRSVINGGHVD